MALMSDEKYTKIQKAYFMEKEKRELKIKLEVQLKDLKDAKEVGSGYNTICCHLTAQQQDKLYLFLKDMLEKELEELLK